ncbi:hypothetical protein E4U52_001256 [Claviceps spartinae]|uniref:Hydrophobin n=1 Tax=Coprinopsis cinerea (strain Okayama-7 / 130 / ATCC MYA-4618 / FGSC 9003) TaxID=240176 RepID=A8P0S1_COPC7|nr:hypothetical protein CC1G_09503 [Coprinopsis cinerea okayama7\|eukprot:XP_001837952.1 hypothetical protein CC1G_09503 [Coprinopsis cinerea okayama7\
MKLAFIAATLLSFFFALVAAVPAGGPNAERLARGLPPLPPVRRHATPAHLAARAQPSGSSSQCNGGTIKCCNSVASSNDAVPKLLSSILNLGLGLNTIVGMQCTNLNALGVGGGSSCTGQTVCCSGNDFNGVITAGCTPISIGA